MSATAAAGGGRLVIERWRNTFVVAGNSPGREAATHDLTRRIDRSIQEDFSASCARRVDRRFGSDATGLWLIRLVHLNFIVDVSKPGAGDIAAEWSDLFSAHLAELIGRGSDNEEGVLYFASRAAYVAQFVLDLAAGRAWGKWYYEEFSSLAMLSTSRAIAEVLSRHPGDGAEAILYLARIGRLDEVLPVITPTDAQKIVNSHSGGAAEADSELSLWVGRLLEVCNAEPMLAGRTALSSFHNRLRWLALAAVRFPSVEFNATSYIAVERLIELRRVLEEIRSSIIADRIVRQLVDGKTDLEEASEIALKQGATSPERGLRFLVETAQGDIDWAVQAVAVLLRDQSTPVQAVVSCDSMVSGFAGMFLLGPALGRLNELLDAIAGESEDSKETASFLRYMVLGRCAGSARILDASMDAALRLLSGCHRLDLRDSSSVGQRIDLKRAYALFLGALGDFAGAEARSLLAEIVDSHHGKEVVLLRDVHRNEWVYAASIEQKAGAREHALITALNLISKSIGSPRIILLDRLLAGFAESVELRRQADRIVTLTDETPGSEINDALLSTGCFSAPLPPEKYTQLIRPSRHEFSYFSSGDLWHDVDLFFDPFGVLLARAAMREFARHLLGFQASSPEYLYRNFLEGIGTVRQESGRIEVELPRAPLLLVLQLSGLTRQTFTLPWLGEKELCLLPPRE
jgi:hypothetical protein